MPGGSKPPLPALHQYKLFASMQEDLTCYIMYKKLQNQIFLHSQPFIFDNLVPSSQSGQYSIQDTMSEWQQVRAVNFGPLHS